MALSYSSSASAAPPNPVPPQREVMQDLQHLMALRPTVDPMTGQPMPQTKGQAREYREALLDIVDRYGDMEAFQKAAGLPSPGSAPAPAPQLASAASPSPPNSTATPPPHVSLARFAADMMGPNPLPAAAGAPQNAGPPGDVTRTRAGPRI